MDLGRQGSARAAALLTSRARSLRLRLQSRAAALPPMVKLDASGEKTIQEQLFEILKEHQVKLIDLFREWDDDGNGALDKKELRAAVAALGYEAPRKEVDALFDGIDVDQSGFIEFHELKQALSEKAVKQAAKDKEKAKAAAEAAARAEEAAAEGDVAGEGEEDLEAGMRQNMMERDAADADQDGKLDFGERPTGSPHRWAAHRWARGEALLTRSVVWRLRR